MLANSREEPFCVENLGVASGRMSLEQAAEALVIWQHVTSSPRRRSRPRWTLSVPGQPGRQPALSESGRQHALPPGRPGAGLP